MQQILKFNIEIPIHNGSKLKHLKDKSFYDHNYYELMSYGDWVDFGRDNNNILYEVYHECENCYSYQFGRFEHGKFIPVFGYVCDDDILEGIDIEEEN